MESGRKNSSHLQRFSNHHRSAPPLIKHGRATTDVPRPGRARAGYHCSIKRYTFQTKWDNEPAANLLSGMIGSLRVPL